MKKKGPFLALLALTASLSVIAERPNIILILADDLAYSDISPYGGEVKTPNLQVMADNGLKFRNFYNGARCCPTRASLLTGLYPHEAGIGHMTSEDEGQRFDYGSPAYQGFLNRQCVTLGEAMKLAGYRTLMTGKWHVGTYEGMWPRDRGFDRFYGLIRGASNFYSPDPDKMLTLDDTPVEYPLPEDYYTTVAFTDYAIEFIDEAVTDYQEDPFFLFLSYTAPHWPIQAPEKYVKPYLEYYEQGWDKLRPKRLQQVIDAGVVPAGTDLSKGVAPAWDSLKPAKQKEMAHRMALYAGMITAMDENIGRLLQHLDKIGEKENTLIVFLSDNGGCAEGGMLGSRTAKILGTKEGYFLTLGEAWANYCNTPFEKYKHYTTEGGIRTPFIAYWPAAIKNTGTWSDQTGHIMDFMPTFLDAANTAYPKTYAGKKIIPPSGKSLLPVLTGEPAEPRRIFFEHEGNKSYIDGDWKLVALYDHPWRLHNLKTDPSELNDLSAAKPERLKTMISAWGNWAEKTQVLPWPAERKAGYEPPVRKLPDSVTREGK